MEILTKIIGVCLGLFVAAVLLPTALNTLANASMTNVDPAVITIVQVLMPVLGVISIAMYFLYIKD
jgi:hypothetical protein